MKGQLQVRFGLCQSGWIRRHISDGTQEVTLWCTHFEDPLPKLLTWLEALAGGLDRCGWTLDEETDRVELNAYVRWMISEVRLDVRPLNDLRLDGVIPLRPTLRFDLPLPDLIGRFYDAFLEFVTSDRYQPEEWSRSAGQGIYDGLDWAAWRSAPVEAWLASQRKHGTFI